jgi:OOP family OmpA-OmpF porin
MKMRIAAVILGMLLSAFAGAGQLFAQEDLHTVKDHQLISRFPGAEVQEHKVTEFDEFVLPLGPILGSGDKFVKSQTIEGKVTKFKYSMPESRSGLEVYKNYTDALQKAHFEILYSCDHGRCIDPKFPSGYSHVSSGIWCLNCDEPMRYVAAELTRAQGNVYVAVVVVKDHYEGGTWLTIVETKPMEGGQVKVNAAALSRDLTENGHALVYGIYFDSGQAVIRPESEAALSEISKMLAANMQLKLVVVGHTDNVGKIASNLTLSKQRADAVAAYLVSHYHVSQERLQAQGVGSLAPVASNLSEEGRAKNRRVELVEE